MTVVALLAAPPRAGLSLPDLPANSPLNAEEAAALAAATTKDAMRAVERSGADLLVNYRPDELLPPEHRTDAEPAAELRALAADALDDVSAVRFEPQVGSTVSARVGNTVTHLLREEDRRSVGVLFGDAPLVTRSAIDGAAMKLRSNEVVLGPGTGADIHYAGFADTVDFTEAFAGPALTSLADLAEEAGHDTEFLPTRPTVGEGGDGLVSVVAQIRARIAAERVVPAHTASLVAEYGLGVDGDGEVVRER